MKFYILKPFFTLECKFKTQSKFELYNRKCRMFEESLQRIVQRIEDDEINNAQILAEQTKDKDVDRLILNHSKPASDVASLLGMNRVSFKEFVETQIEEGKLEPILKIKNQWKYTLEHIHTLMDLKGIPAWKDQNKGTQVIAVSNLKGGTGKTTTTCSLATAFALDLVERKRVLLIDLDPQGSQSDLANIDLENSPEILTAVDLMLGDKEPDSIYAALKQTGMSHEQIVKESLVYTHIPNLSILPAFPDDERFNSKAWSDTLEKASRGDGSDIENLHLLKEKVIDAVKDDFDVIFIDTAPHMDPLVWSALEAATGLLVPCMPHEIDWKATKKFLKGLGNVKESLPSKGDNLKWGRVIATNHEEGQSNNAARSAKVLNKMKSTLGSELLNNQIPNSAAFEAAAQRSCTVFDFKKSEKEMSDKQLDLAVTRLNACARELMLFINDTNE
jgi:cellulose biosynthesis protein BcsQ